MFLFSRNRAIQYHRRAYSVLSLIIEEKDAKLVHLDCNYRVFGNIQLSVEHRGHNYMFITDRDEIYCNGRLMPLYYVPRMCFDENIKKLAIVVWGVLSASE